MSVTDAIQAAERRVCAAVWEVIDNIKSDNAQVDFDSDALLDLIEDELRGALAYGPDEE